MRVVFVFFFQAEDGIRDIGVTGVQTCALPISSLPVVKYLSERQDRAGRRYVAALSELARVRKLLGREATAGPGEAGPPDREGGVVGKRGELGGRRILKKKKNTTRHGRQHV